MNAADCPSVQEISAYAAGKLDEATSEALSRHIETCSSCQDMLATLREPPDSLVVELRQLAVADPYVQEPQCPAALSRAKALTPEWASGAAEPEGAAGGESANLGELGEYRLLARLGKGGMGVVYKALHTKLGRKVALKILPEGRLKDDDALVRFQREMLAVGRLNHPNIVQAYDAREIDGTHLLVMECVEGKDLSELLRENGPLPVREACELIRQAAVGLQYAHENGLVHRDVKPSNLMLTPEGQVKILDLGLALFLVDDVRDDGLTEAGQVMGTTDYMAPEQALDTHKVDIRADVYSLGCTLYSLLTGRTPFAGPQYDTPLKKVTGHARDTATPVRQLRPEVPEDLAAVIERMMAKEPADRFSTPGEVAAALAPLAAGCDPADSLVHADPALRSAGEEAQCSVTTEQFLSRAEVSTESPVLQTPARFNLSARMNAGKLGCAFAVTLTGLLVAMPLVIGWRLLLSDRQIAERPGSLAESEKPAQSPPESVAMRIQEPPRRVEKPGPRPAMPAAKPTWDQVLADVRDGLFLLEAEHPSGQAIWPVANACAIRDDTLLTTGTAALALADFRQKGWKIWARNPAGGSRRQIKGFRVHKGYQEIPEKPDAARKDPRMYLDLALVTMAEGPSAAKVLPLAPAAELAEGLPVADVGIPVGTERVSSLEGYTAEVHVGKVFRIDPLSEQPGSPMLLDVTAPIPVLEGKTGGPSFVGSPVVDGQGRVVGVYSVPPLSPEAKDLEIHNVVETNLVRLWLAGKGTQSWVEPLPSSLNSSALILAQADYLESAGYFLESASIARRNRALAARQEMNNALHWVDTYFEVRERNRAWRLKENPEHLTRLKKSQDAMRDEITNFLQNSLKNDITGKLNWFLDELSGPVLAYEYQAGDKTLADTNLDEKLRPGDIHHLRLTDGGHTGGANLIFRADDAKVLQADWPRALRKPEFEDVRVNFETVRDALLKELQGNGRVTWEKEQALIEAVDRVTSRFNEVYSREVRMARQSERSRSGDVEYKTGRRFLQSLAASVFRALSTNDRSVFDDYYKFTGDSVVDLLFHMYQNGLEFAPPEPGDEATYQRVLLSMRELYLPFAPDRKMEWLAGSKPGPASSESPLAPVPEKKPAAAEYRIALPSGKSFDSAKLEGIQQAMEEQAKSLTITAMQPGNALEVVAVGRSFPSTSATFFCTHDQGQPDGVAVAFYPGKDPITSLQNYGGGATELWDPGQAPRTGPRDPTRGAPTPESLNAIWSNVRVETYAEYNRGKLDGLLATWDERGQKGLWCTYKHDRRHGMCCLFEDDRPRLIAECENGRVRSVHLISDGKIEESFDGEEQAKASETASALLEQFDRTEAEAKATESACAKNVHKMFLMYVGKLSAAKRATMMERMAQRSAENQKALNALKRRTALGQ